MRLSSRDNGLSPTRGPCGSATVDCSEYTAARRDLLDERQWVCSTFSAAALRFASATSLRSSSTRTRPSWCRRASTSTRGHVPGHYAKVLFRSPSSPRPSTARAGPPFPWGSPWSARWWKAFCVRWPTIPTSQLEALAAHRSRCFDRYPVPASRSKDRWSEARAELARRLQLIGQHPPKRAFDIPEPFAKAYFDLMPIHKSLRDCRIPDVAQLSEGDIVQHP